MTEKLSDAERDAALSPLIAAGWSDLGDAIEKSFVFQNFVEAWGFMSQCAIWAEKLNHHPEWSNVYKTVDVRLTTHDAGGLSKLDIELGKTMDKIAGT